MIVEALMIVERDYHGYRFEVVALHVKGAWDAEVRIRCTPPTTTACAGHLSCRAASAQIAEERGAMCARRWIDRHGQS